MADVLRTLGRLADVVGLASTRGDSSNAVSSREAMNASEVGRAESSAAKRVTDLAISSAQAGDWTY